MNENPNPINEQQVQIFLNQNAAALQNQQYNPQYPQEPQGTQGGIKLTLLEDNLVYTSARIQKDQQGPVKVEYQISYEKNDLVIYIAGSKGLSKDNKEKAKPNQYSNLDVDNPELFDGKIKCARLKCVVFGIITAILNTIRLGYLMFLHLGYPAIVWCVRFICAIYLFIYTFFDDNPETIEIESETGYERIDYERGKFALACSLCFNCAKAFGRFVVNLVKCPCWFYYLVTDCIYDIKNRALDNARNGCYKFIHNDCGCYEKVIEDPFNNYMKKRHIIMTTDPDDDSVIYGDACKDNTII